MFPNRVPMGSNTTFPEALVYFPIIQLFIHVCLPESRKKEPSYIHMGYNLRSPSTEPHADRSPTHNGVRTGALMESLRHCCLYPSAKLPSARYSVLYYTLFCIILCSVLYSVLYYTLFCIILCSVL
jgi:hypothetical protein